MRVIRIRQLDHFCVTVDPFDALAIAGFLRANGIEHGEVAIRYGA